MTHWFVKGLAEGHKEAYERAFGPPEHVTPQEKK